MPRRARSAIQRVISWTARANWLGSLSCRSHRLTICTLSVRVLVAWTRVVVELDEVELQEEKMNEDGEVEWWEGDGRRNIILCELKQSTLP